MSDDARREHRRLVLAAVVAGGFALALVALGWWLRDWRYRSDEARFLDPSWWGGSLTSGLGLLAFGKVGFKLGLLAVAAVLGGTVWLRRRRLGIGTDGTNGGGTRPHGLGHGTHTDETNGGGDRPDDGTSPHGGGDGGTGPDGTGGGTRTDGTDDDTRTDRDTRPHGPDAVDG